MVKRYNEKEKEMSSNIDRSISNELIDNTLASTEEFWKTFHNSLQAPYHTYNEFKDNNLVEWFNMCNKDNDFVQHLELLFDYPLLKGEYLLAKYKGFILTNYRLIINDVQVGKPSIPLLNINSYNKDGNGIIIFNRGEEIVKLQYHEFLTESVINSAISRISTKTFNDFQILCLGCSHFELSELNSDLKIPKISMDKPKCNHKDVTEDKLNKNNKIGVNPVISESKSKSNNENTIDKHINDKKSNVKGWIGFLAIIIIGAILIFGGQGNKCKLAGCNEEAIGWKYYPNGTETVLGTMYGPVRKMGSTSGGYCSRNHCLQDN